MKENISEHISYDEATHTSVFGVPNIPTAEYLESMKYVANGIFEKVRAHFGKPIAINSFFRSSAVNAKIAGASKTSQHSYGEAIDMSGTPYGVSNKDIFNYIKDNLTFDQLIWENGTNENPAWVHCSLKRGINRRSVLRKRANSNGYEKFV